jgi:hypothetical protein
MSLIVRRAPVDRPFDEASRLFRAYADGRTVSLLGLAAKATLQGEPAEPRCLVRWEPDAPATPGLTQFNGVLWLEPDDQDDGRAWLVLDGECAERPEDRLADLAARRLMTAAIARDLLARVGDVVEARGASQSEPPG